MCSDLRSWSGSCQHLGMNTSEPDTYVYLYSMTPVIPLITERCGGQTPLEREYGSGSGFGFEHCQLAAHVNSVASSCHTAGTDKLLKSRQAVKPLRQHFYSPRQGKGTVRRVAQSDVARSSIARVCRQHLAAVFNAIERRCVSLRTVR